MTDKGEKERRGILGAVLIIAIFLIAGVLSCQVMVREDRVQSMKGPQ